MTCTPTCISDKYPATTAKSMAEDTRTALRPTGTPPAPSPVPAHGTEFVRDVYTHHGTVLLRYASGLVGHDLHRAEDIVQEAVLRAWRRIDALDTSAERLRPWLFTVIRNLAIDGHRSRGSRPTEVEQDLSAEHTVPDETERVVTTQLVADALGDLTPQHREVLLHVHYLGNSVRETALVLGIPEGTVKSRTYKASRALRAALDRRGYTR